MPDDLPNPRILLGVSGGIAAYKTPDLVRRLRERGCEVRVVMTRGAEAFITPLTLQAVSGHPVHVKRCSMPTRNPAWAISNWRAGPTRW